MEEEKSKREKEEQLKAEEENACRQKEEENRLQQHVLKAFGCLNNFSKPMLKHLKSQKSE